MHSCLIFPFLTGGPSPMSSVYSFCLLFTGCCEGCSFMCLVLCSSATGCEAIYFFLFCSWLPLKRHVQKKEEKHILPISCSHISQTRGPSQKKTRTAPVGCIRRGTVIHHKLCSLMTSSAELIVVLISIIGKHLYFFQSFANAFNYWNRLTCHILASEPFTLQFM